VYGRRKIAVVVPAYDEERLIGRTVSTLPRYVDHVIVVDDGSRDGTAAQAQATGGARLVVLRHAKNRGVGAAIASGYRAALSIGADIAVVVGADAQMDPDEMDRLIEPIATGAADYVKGNRLGHAKIRERMPHARWVANRLLTRLTRLALDADVTDSQCGYTAISRHALERVPLERLWPRYGYPNDLLGWVLGAGMRVAERPVTPIYGDERSHIQPLTIGPTLAWVLARAWWRRRRAAAPSPFSLEGRSL
jgi:glycosyltransferase involved in cell wall biosynthesis